MVAKIANMNAWQVQEHSPDILAKRGNGIAGKPRAVTSGYRVLIYRSTPCAQIGEHDKRHNLLGPG